MTWPSMNASPCQWKWDSRSTGALVIREPTMNRSCASSSWRRLPAESIPASATTTMSAREMPFLELLDDRDQGRGLGLVAFEAADLQREPVPVDQQTDHDLRVDPALRGVADLAQLVFLLGLEVQRGDVVQAQGQVTAGGGV